MPSRNKIDSATKCSFVWFLQAPSWPVRSSFKNTRLRIRMQTHNITCQCHKSEWHGSVYTRCLGHREHFNIIEMSKMVRKEAPKKARCAFVNHNSLRVHSAHGCNDTKSCNEAMTVPQHLDLETLKLTIEKRVERPSTQTSMPLMAKTNFHISRSDFRTHLRRYMWYLQHRHARCVSQTHHL